MQTQLLPQPAGLNSHIQTAPILETYTAPLGITNRITGQRFYELSNHLGNVLSTVSDNKLLAYEGTALLKYKAEVISYSDYYPFGWEMPGRGGSSEAYRYGFNGKEKDDEGEIGGQTTYDYGFRIYNPAIGKFLSVDPLTGNYPWYTPYQFAGNKPIWAIDLDGLEEYIYQYRRHADMSVTLIRKITNTEIKSVPVNNRLGFGLRHVDKRTGKEISPEELGMAQYQYYDANDDPIKERRNMDGNFVKGDNEWIPVYHSNWFGSTFIGPSNPSDPSDKDGDDYRREPQDLMDAAAKRHDKDYGIVGAEGIGGATIDKNAIAADIALVQRANMVIKMEGEGAIDPYTGEAISRETLTRAEVVKAGFTVLVKNKAEIHFKYASKELLNKMLKQTREIDNTETRPTGFIEGEN